MTTRSFLKSSTIRPGSRHGATITLDPKTPVLASGKFVAMTPGVLALAATGCDTEILAIVHGSLCTEVKLPQDALAQLDPSSTSPAPRFVRYGAIKAAARYNKHMEIAGDGLVSTGTFRFLGPAPSGTLELTYPNGTVNVILIARAYLYVEEKPPVDMLAAVLGATLGVTDDDAEDTPAPAAPAVAVPPGPPAK